MLFYQDTTKDWKGITVTLFWWCMNSYDKTRQDNGNLLDSLCQDVVLLRYKNFIVVNPDKDIRLCRTLKTQYYKNSIANIFHKGTFGCSGVIQIVRE